MNAHVPTSEPAPSSLRTTLVLTAVVAALGLWIWLGEGHIDPAKAQKERRVFPHLATADVTKLELTPTGGAQVVVERAPPAKGAGAEVEPKEGEAPAAPDAPKPWRLTAPVEDAADSGEVTRVLNGLEWLEFTDKLEAEHASGYDFGDVVVKARIERTAGKPPFVFELGPERLGKRPLRVEGSPGVVFLVREALAKDLTQDPWRLRKKQLFEQPRDGLAKATLRAAPEQAGPGVAERATTLLRADGYWRLGAGDGEFAVEGLVDELVNDLYGLQAAGVSSEAPAEADLARLGLAPPRAVIALEGQGGKVEQLELGLPVEGEPALRHARFTGRAAALKVDAKVLAAELERPAAGWRTDTLLPLRGAAATLTGLGVTLPSGEAWGLTKLDGRWRFDGEAQVPAAAGPVEALLQDVLALTIKDRLPSGEAPDLKALGLDPPALKLAVVQERLRREVWIGGPVEGQPGVHHVKRVGEERVFTVHVGPLPGRLEDARLELLDKTIFEASHWDAKKVVITAPDGAVLLEAAKTEEGVKEWKVTTPAQADAVSEKVDRFMETFEAMKVERWLSLDSAEARARHGLGRPTTVAVTIETFKDGKKTDVVKTLLVGRREGERAAALAEGGHAIGRVDASFFDRLARGFAKETSILESDRWNVKGFVVRDGQEVVLELKKPAENWKRVDGGQEQILETTEVEDLLERFEKVEVSRAEPRADARLAEVGLAPPARTITITIKPYDKPEEARTLHLGRREGDRDVWASAEGATVMGLLFDEPLRALDAWLREHPLPAAFPPVDDDAPPNDPGDPGAGQQGSTTTEQAPPPPTTEQAPPPPTTEQAPPAGSGDAGAATPPQAPTEVPCAVCSAMVPAGGPFAFRDPRPPHPVYDVCSPNHLDELKALLHEQQDAEGE